MASDTSLLLPKSKAEEEIRRRLDRGRELLSRNITSAEELEQVISEHQHWKSNTSNLLGRLFSDYSIANQFYGDNPEYKSSSDVLVTYKQFLEDELERLEFVLTRLPFIQERLRSDDHCSSANTTQVVKSLDAQSRSNLKLPEKVTMAWLVHHVPYTLWISLTVLLIGSFGFGAKVGQIDWVQTLLGNSPKTQVIDGRAPSRAAWSGSWDTDTGTYKNLRVLFTESSGEVVGTYRVPRQTSEIAEGRIKGKISGNALVGKWTERRDGRDIGGEIHFVLLDDGRSFLGSYTREWERNREKHVWTGRRVE